MKIVNIHEAKTTLFARFAEVEEREQAVIARNGEPIAQLTRIEPTPGRQPGLLRTPPGWRDFAFDPSVFAPLTDEELAAEGWPV
ncbi:MAG TPA: hypothetical protein VFE41_22550 [Acetobacteraceae bacterium]|jgi:antitoxin (DNA-binding transcriptional repressor) of toxin-antitoxin stability system|nr:hypothetical protein [Acetobacteraceae bacterium]